MTLAYPLTRHDRLDAAFAVASGETVGETVTAERFLRDATALAAMLLPRRHLINLCSDRYHFAVALAAALMRDQLSLMPPSDMSAVLESIAIEFDDLYIDP